jgi:hypothetical protein
MAIETATTSTEVGVASANARQFRGLFDYVIPAKVNFEEDSIAAGASSAAVYTVLGAQLGDFVLVAANSDLGDDLIFTAQVTDANEVTVVATDASAATNTSAATVGTLYLLVLGLNRGAFDNAASF